MTKIGRNDPCDCGSGKKYKKCHGRAQEQPANTPSPSSPAAALEVQRRRQQGEGRPIISAKAFGQRFIAVKSRLLHSGNWLTVPDFLGDYIKTAMGADWGNAELAKPSEQRHPIIKWYQALCEEQKRAKAATGDKVFSTPKTGAIAAYLHLAYDLFTLEHNAELQAKMIERLRLADNFEGARYEVFVAAMLIRAGFDIEFENEDDRSRSHCEFTATYRRTGKKFSVEAKCRTGSKFRIGRQLNRALAKRADHARLVFIEINEPDDGSEEGVPLLKNAMETIRTFEGKKINGALLPDACVVVTNTPRHHHLQTEQFRCSALIEGFQIPDLKLGAEFPNLRAAIDARARHIEMHELMKSIRDHSDIPPTFDGEIPEFANTDGPPRLIIGNRYLIPDENGVEQPALLTSATVSEPERKAYCALSFPNGRAIMCTWPLSDAEMAAWKKYPDTFFGVVGQRTTKANDPLDLYDFFLSSYKATPKERLLELLAGSPDIAFLKEKDQATLASIYAERCATAAFIK